jgi:hypothetical protein
MNGPKLRKAYKARVGKPFGVKVESHFLTRILYRTHDVLQGRQTQREREQRIDEKCRTEPVSAKNVELKRQSELRLPFTPPKVAVQLASALVVWPQRNARPAGSLGPHFGIHRDEYFKHALDQSLDIASNAIETRVALAEPDARTARNDNTHLTMWPSLHPAVLSETKGADLLPGQIPRFAILHAPGGEVAFAARPADEIRLCLEAWSMKDRRDRRVAEP